MDLKGKGMLVVLSGPSGSGKDTVLEKLKETDISFDIFDCNKYWVSISVLYDK